MTDPIAVILAGGTSSRMGTDKATFPFGGKPMIEWVIGAATEALGRVVVVGRKTQIGAVECIPDSGGSHRGPLSGIVTALRAVDAPIVVLAADQPLVGVITIRSIAEHGDQEFAAIPVEDGLEQVTCARYPRGWRDLAASALDRDLSIRDVVRTNDCLRIDEDLWSSWGEDGRSWFSIDEPGDVVAAERRFRLNLH